MIDDAELRDLFQAEAEEHLQALQNGVVQLRDPTAGADTLDELLREAHSLKGAARMLDLSDIEMLMHALEDGMRGLQAQGEPRAVADLKPFLAALDATDLLVKEALGGARASVDLRAVMGALHGITPGSQTAGLPDESAIEALPSIDPHIDEPLAEAGGEQIEAERSPRLMPVPDSGQAGPDSPGHPVPATSIPATSVPAMSGAAVDQKAISAQQVEAVGAPVNTVDDNRPRPESVDHRFESLRVSTRLLDTLMKESGELVVTERRCQEQVTAFSQWFDELQRWASDAGAEQRLPDAQVGRLNAILQGLEQIKQAMEGDGDRLGKVTHALSADIADARLLPVSVLFEMFPRSVMELAEAEGKQVRLEIDAGDVRVDKQVIQALKDPLMHLIRNAIHHGVESAARRTESGKDPVGTVRLQSRRHGSAVEITVADDGQGIDQGGVVRRARELGLLPGTGDNPLTDMALFALVFHSGFSTERRITDLAGRGVGLDVVRHNVDRLKGEISLTTAPGKGTDIHLKIPVSIATTRVLFLRAAGLTFALPLDGIGDLQRRDVSEIFKVDGKETLKDQFGVFSCHALDALLGLGRTDHSAGLRPCAVLKIGEDRLGIWVDEFIDEQEVVVQPFGGVIRRVRNLIGFTALANGEICMVLSASHLITQALHTGHVGSHGAAASTLRKPAVLLVDDSLLTRVRERRILEGAGYRVVMAVDGVDALEQLQRQSAEDRFAAVISDINMPRMDGMTLVRELRADNRYKELPVILVTARAEDGDRRRGLELGADAYLTKPAFDPDVLLATLQRLL